MAQSIPDTVDTLLAQYVAGTLPEPVRVLMGAHLELKDSSRIWVRDLEFAAGTALEDMAPEPLTERDRCLDTIFATKSSSEHGLEPTYQPTAGFFPKAIQEFIGFDLDQVPWKTKLPGFKEHIIGNFDGFEASLFWIRPGRAVPAHTHEGTELFLVVDGAYNDTLGRFARGDIAYADATIDHRPIAEPGRPCVGFAVVDAPLKLTGSFRQLIGDLIG